MRLDAFVNRFLAERQEILTAVDDIFLGEADLTFEQLTSERVHALPLLVHDVVIFEEMLADGKVLGFDLALRPLDGPGHHLVLDRTPSSMPSRCISPEIRSEPKMRIRSSSSER